MRSLLLMMLLPALLACGDDVATPAPDASTDAGHDAGTDSGTDAGSEDACRVLTLGPRDFQFNIFGQLTGLRHSVTSNLDGPAEDFLLVELYDSTTEGLPPLQPGSFDLAAPGNDDLATCQHCLWVKVDETESGTVAAIYWQTEGTLMLDRVSDPLEPIFAGTTSRVVLRRATVTEDGHSMLVPGGDCVEIQDLAFDTAPTPGAACLSADDCGNALLEICDPDDNTCGEPECGEFVSCLGEDEVCISQYRDLFFGACYRTCDPSGSSECGVDRRCVQFGVDPSFGICKQVGDGEAGASCEVEDNGTSCAGEAVCSEVTKTCSLSCGFFDADPGCDSESLCTLFGVCEPPSAGSDVPLGEPCDPNAELATGCAPDGEAFRGICFAYPPEAPICEKACLGELGCADGEFCALRFTSGLGICRPVPVCGDGELGEIDEVCDDGNVVSGDGCSSDCRTVEYDVICSSLPGLSLGPPAQGNTASGRDGFQSSCQLGIARAQLFRVTPPGPGRLTLRLDSETDQALSLRADCADPVSELACSQNGFGGETEELVYQVTSTVALTAMVSAFTVLDEGPFTLSAEFVPEQCGDGIVAGNEVCDYGNTNGDDGCSGDCREVEYDFYCAGAAELSTNMLNVGDTTGAPNLFGNACSDEVESPSSGDRLYRYVAPSDGMLHLFLQSNENLIVVVLDGCGRPEEVTELGCNSSFTLGTVDVQLSAGQMITVFVDGFTPRDEGTYGLQAIFIPD